MDLPVQKGCAAVAQQPYSYRNDASVPAFPDDRPIIVFDGHCVLCSGFARFVMRVDTARQFRLLAAQTPIGSALYCHYGLDPVDYQTNLLIADGVAYFKSDGSMRLFQRLGLPWSLVGIGRILPGPVRDGLYSMIARHRLNWFGRREICFRPDPADADRFIT